MGRKGGINSRGQQLKNKRGLEREREAREIN